MYGARRPAGDKKSLWRINQFIMPFYTMPPGGELRAARIWVPIDDENCIKWMINWFPTEGLKESSPEIVQHFQEEDYAPETPEPYGFIRPRAQKSNDYLIDWKMHSTKRMGITGVNLQDRCVTENEGPTPILDRSLENLCEGDMTIVKARRMLLQAATALRDSNVAPPGARDATVYRVRATSRVVPNNINWAEDARNDVTVPADVKMPAYPHAHVV
jgi:hypothetical protein